MTHAWAGVKWCLWRSYVTCVHTLAERVVSNAYIDDGHGAVEIHPSVWTVLGDIDLGVWNLSAAHIEMYCWAPAVSIAIVWVRTRRIETPYSLIRIEQQVTRR